MLTVNLANLDLSGLCQGAGSFGLHFVVYRPLCVNFRRFSCSLSILICLTFDVLDYWWRFDDIIKTAGERAIYIT